MSSIIDSKFKYYHHNQNQDDKMDVKLIKKSKIYRITDDDQDDDGQQNDQQNGQDFNLNDKNVEKINKNFNNKKKNFKNLLNLIGFMNLDRNLYNKIKLLFQQQNNDKNLNEIEKNLLNQYKCESYHNDNCFFTNNDLIEFKKHLNDKHLKQLLFCFYCKQQQNLENEDEHKNCLNISNFMDPDELINHINEKHLKNLCYQCNFCFYRSSTIDHLLIHYSIVHTEQFFNTIRYLMKKLNNEDGEICKIINCSINEQDHDQDDEIKNDQNDCIVDDGKIHCFYCNYSINNEDDDVNDIWIHFMKCHRNCPINFYYNDINDDDDDDIDDNEIDDDNDDVIMNKIDEMQKTLEKYSSKYKSMIMNDRKFIQKAIDNWFDKDSLKIINDKDDKKSGIKRKNIDNEDEIDNSNNDENIEILKNIENNVNKKRRTTKIFNQLVDLEKTKKLFNIATTFILALGFYQFSQYLPFTIQTILDKM